jgi:hypothetical protein
VLRTRERTYFGQQCKQRAVAMTKKNAVEERESEFFGMDKPEKVLSRLSSSGFKNTIAVTFLNSR